YKGGGPALNDLIAGQVHVLFGSPGSVLPHVKSGRLRALGVTSARPSALVPGVPAIAAAGVPGYEMVSTEAVFAPAHTPGTIVARVNETIRGVLGQPDGKEKFFNAGAEAAGSTPQELTARLDSEMRRFGKVIRDAGIRAE